MATTNPSRGRTRSSRRQSPAATLLLLVRHGTTPTTGKVLPGTAKGLHLAEKGEAEAQAVADRLAKMAKVEAIYSSPLERARETAAPIARGLNLRVTVDRGLSDCDVGDWTGMALKAVAKRPEWRIVQRWPSGFRFPNGESFTEMQARVVSTLDHIRRVPRRSHQGRGGRRRGYPPRPVPAHLHLAVLGDRGGLRRRRSLGAHRESGRVDRRSQGVVRGRAARAEAR